jgi:hypothetical protein
MPRVLPVSLATAAAGVPACPFQHHFWIGKGSDGSMLTHPKNWVRGSGQRKRDRWEADHGHLSEQEKFVADEYQPGREPSAYPTKGFDEQSRGRPGN